MHENQWFAFNVSVLMQCQGVPLVKQQSRQLASFKEFFTNKQPINNGVMSSDAQQSLDSPIPLIRTSDPLGAAHQFALVRLSDSLDDAFVIVDSMIQSAENPCQRNQLAHLARCLFKAIDASSVIN